jgi:outer membrane lipoprotein-sorting protein
VKQNEAIPDSLLLTLDPKLDMITKLEFFDINGERNRIEILKQELYEKCSDSIFLPNYPDSVEWIRF